jgi:flagellar protein FliS
MENASNEYLRNAVLTAPPEQLHLMLYDGALRFTRQGIEGIKQEKWEDAFNGFSRAQRITLEMLNALNYDVDRELCTRMAGLYNFIYQRLVQACVGRSVAAAEDAVKILELQRETWVMLIDKLCQERAGTASASLQLEEGDDSREAPYQPLSVEG